MRPAAPIRLLDIFPISLLAPTTCSALRRDLEKMTQNLNGGKPHFVICKAFAIFSVPSASRFSTSQTWLASVVLVAMHVISHMGVRMEHLIEDIEKALENKLFYLSLIGILDLIDICGALDSEDGCATGGKFKKWMQEYIPHYKVLGEVSFSAESCWLFRCSILHQFKSQHTKSDLVAIAFSPEVPCF